MAAGGRFGERLRSRAARPFWSRRELLVMIWFMQILSSELLINSIYQILDIFNQNNNLVFKPHFSTERQASCNFEKTLTYKLSFDWQTKKQNNVFFFFLKIITIKIIRSFSSFNHYLTFLSKKILKKLWNHSFKKSQCC